MTQTFTVAEARKRLRPPMRQEDLAALVGIDQAYVSLIEAGKRVPSDDLKKRLAKALKLRPVQLKFETSQLDATVKQSTDRSGQTQSSDSGRPTHAGRGSL